jgi:hypothetical protein
VCVSTFVRLLPFDLLTGVIGSHDYLDGLVCCSCGRRSGGQLADRLPHPGDDLVVAGVALRPAGAPPAGNRSHAPVQGAQRDRRAAQPLPHPADRPRLGLVQQPADALGEPTAAQAEPTGSGPVGKPGGAMVVVAVDPAAHGPGSAA